MINAGKCQVSFKERVWFPKFSPSPLIHLLIHLSGYFFSILDLSLARLLDGGLPQLSQFREEETWTSFHIANYFCKVCGQSKQHWSDHCSLFVVPLELLELTPAVVLKPGARLLFESGVDEAAERLPILNISHFVLFPGVFVFLTFCCSAHLLPHQQGLV